MNHNNIVKLIQGITEGQIKEENGKISNEINYFIVLEYIQGGELFSCIKQ